jgi:hypothetical protein
MKMEQTECSETSAYKIQTPGNYPEESRQHLEQGECLKSRMIKQIQRFDTPQKLNFGLANIPPKGGGVMWNFFSILSVGVCQHVTVYFQLSGIIAGRGGARIIQNMHFIEPRTKNKILSPLLCTQYIHIYIRNVRLLFTHTVSDLCLY